MVFSLCFAQRPVLSSVFELSKLFPLKNIPTCGPISCFIVHPSSTYYIFICTLKTLHIVHLGLPCSFKMLVKIGKTWISLIY